MSTMAEKPSVLFMSCSDTQPDEIIKLILNVSELPEKVEVDDHIYAFPWLIDNKYYQAEVNLCCLSKKSLSNKRFSDTVQAVVLHFDSSRCDALDVIESWLPFVNEYEPEIKILLCKNVSDDSKDCSKRSTQEWCVGRGFELVELEPIIEDDEADDDLEDDFPETTGVKRIIQALNAHVWPNLILKTTEVGRSKPVDYSQSELKNLKDQLCLEESLEEMLENDDDFSQLFSQLPDMKARVASLSGADRKAAAEQVVKAFWKALGGDDEDEFLDL